MHYVCIDDLLDDVRVALKAHPSERETLKAIAAIARRNGLEAGIAAFADWQNAIAGGGKAESPQPAAPESAQTGNDAPDGALHTDAGQGASSGITGQSTLPGEADTGTLPAAKPDVEADVAGRAISLLHKMFGASPLTPAHASQPDSPTRADAGQEAAGSAMTQGVQPGEVQTLSIAPQPAQTCADPAGDTLPMGASQNASVGTTAQGTLSGTADSQPDDAARLQAQIDGCLALETDPALRLFLERLARDAHKYPAEFVRQELEAYLQAANPDDFLNRLAALHWGWTLDDVAADPDGKWLKRGNAGEREAVLARIQANFEWESKPVPRCYLAKLARQAVTDPVKAADGLEGYLDGRASPTWVWLAAVFVFDSPEAAFQWRLQEVRRGVTNARLSGYLDTLEQAAHRNLPAAASKLEALVEVMALLDGQAEAAQNAPGNLAAGLPAAVA